tara:strand:+ start:494 stop:883 length:390 start_codon:yes stop_codon:yes gene_type:complete
MPALTITEKKAFSADQLTQLARLSTTRRDEYLTPEESDDGVADDGTFRANILAKMAKRTPDQLRARVNVVGVAWGSTPTVTYSTENDYTQAEMEAIQQGLKAGDKWGERVADIVAGGLSLEQRVDALES